MTYREQIEQAVSEGFAYLDFLTASDHISHRRISVLLINPDTAEQRFISEDLDNDECQSISDVFKNAAWHERETREMFGIEFIGLADTRRLLTTDDMPEHPLRKS